MVDSVWQLSWPALVTVFVIILIGGVVRGFGGFGASMIWVTGMSVVLSPKSVIPTALMLEVLASVQVLPQVWRDVHWPSLRWLTAGTLAGLPLGIWVLVTVDEQAMRATLAVLVLLAAASMATKFRTRAIPGARVATGVGVVSGAMNGAVAMGGPPVILMYFSSPQHVVAGRASLIVFFMLSDLLATGGAVIGGVVSGEWLAQVGLLLPVSLTGVAIGGWWYRRAAGANVRRVVLWLLTGLACVVLAQSVWHYA